MSMSVNGHEIKPYAYLRGANLQGANLPKFQIPQEGTLTVFKKLKESVTAKLLIPDGAKRTASLVGRKCRAEKAIILELSNSELFGYSRHQSGFRYEVGKEVVPDKYCDDIRIECSQGVKQYIADTIRRRGK